MDCLILCDDIDCQPLSQDLVSLCLAEKLKPKLVLRQHFKTVIEESRHLPPFLLFNETAARIDNFINVQAENLRLQAEDECLWTT